MLHGLVKISTSETERLAAMIFRTCTGSIFGFRERLEGESTEDSLKFKIFAVLPKEPNDTLLRESRHRDTVVAYRQAGHNICFLCSRKHDNPDAAEAQAYRREAIRRPSLHKVSKRCRDEKHRPTLRASHASHCLSKLPSLSVLLLERQTTCDDRGSTPAEGREERFMASRVGRGDLQWPAVECRSSPCRLKFLHELCGRRFCHDRCHQLPRCQGKREDARDDGGVLDRYAQGGFPIGALSSLSSAPLILALGVWRRSSRGRSTFHAVRCALPSGLELDTSPDISERPEKRLVPELSRYEDPDDPVRPPAPLRDRAGLWAPPSPEAIGAPEVLVVGLGRRLRVAAEDGPRARLGVGALEALQRRYQIRSYFDADVQGYMATCKASLDKSGRAGVQKIHLMQPLIDDDFDVPTHLPPLISVTYWRLRAFAESRHRNLQSSLQDEVNAAGLAARVLFQEASELKGKAKPEAVGGDIYGPGKAKDDLEEVENAHLAVLQPYVAGQIRVRDCHKSSFINESAELRLLCSDEGVLINLLDVQETMTLCFPDQRVVVHDGLPLNFASPPAGLQSTCGAAKNG
eukprot:s1943_g12.t1